MMLLCMIRCYDLQSEAIFGQNLTLNLRQLGVSSLILRGGFTMLYRRMNDREHDSAIFYDAKPSLARV